MTEAPQQQTTLQKIESTLVHQQAKFRDLMSLAFAGRPDDFVKHVIAQTRLQCVRNQAIMKCDPQSIVFAVTDACQTGLEIDNVEGAMIGFYNSKASKHEAKFLPMVQGLIKKAHESGAVKTIAAQPVYKLDFFEEVAGTSPSLIHKPNRLIPRDTKDNPLILFYAVVQLLNGGTQFEVMSLSDVEAVRQRSRSRDNGPWVTDFNEMGRKTVVKRLWKYLPKTPAMQQVALLDRKAEEEDDDTIVTRDGTPALPVLDQFVADNAPTTEDKTS